MRISVAQLLASKYSATNLLRVKFLSKDHFFSCQNFHMIKLPTAIFCSKLPHKGNLSAKFTVVNIQTPKIISNYNLITRQLHLYSKI